MSFRNFRKRVKRALGREVSSDSDDDTDFDGELLPYNPDLDTQLQERKRRYEETGRQRAESPTDDQSAYMERKRTLKGRRQIARQEQAQAAQEAHSREINQIIDSISRALGTNVDEDDPRIRFLIGQIVNAHGLTINSLRLMGRSRILLSAIGDVASRAGRGLGDVSQVVYSAGQAALAALRAAGRLAARSASAVASSLPRLPSRFSSQPRAQEQGPPLDPAIAMRSDFGEAESRQAAYRQQQVAADELLARHLSRNLDAERAAFSRFGSAQNAVLAPASAPPPLPPARAPDAEEDICTICMAGPGINDSGIDRGQLGYIERHSILAQGHPNKFHNSCLQECLRLDPRCPMCRAVGPVWGLERPPGQGGGGSRKTRSKSKSKSKSKTRRLRKSRKPRKSCKSRKPRSLSYRRK
jgi:hypothetical protein